MTSAQARSSMSMLVRDIQVRYTKAARVAMRLGWGAGSLLGGGGLPASGEDGLLAMERWELVDFSAGFLFGEAQLVELLQVQPELRAGAEEVGQA